MSTKRKAVGRSVVKASKKSAKDEIPSKKRARADESEEDEIDDDDDVVLKKPAMATLKRPAAAKDKTAEDEEDEDEEEEDDEEEEEKEENPAQDARDAIKVVQQKNRIIRSLSSANDKLYEKIKANKALLRKAEKELEGAKDVAKKKTRKLGAIQGAKMRKQMLAKKNRVKGQKDKAAAAVEVATKRYNKMRRMMGQSRGKTSDVEGSFKKAQASYEDAKKLCAKLKKEGEDVPDEGAKDFSAKFAWKPPGLRAAKARDDAKAAFLKAKQAWEKAALPNKKREERLAALKAKVEEAKTKQEEAEAAAKELKKKEKAKK